MIRRTLVAAVLVTAGVAGLVQSGSVRVGAQAASQNHVAWVATTLTRMLTIKPGMTRKDLNALFTTEGGLVAIPPVHRTFVSRDCPYFKVDVDFELVASPGEDPRDTIVKVSRPYLQFSIMNQPADEFTAR